MIEESLFKTNFIGRDGFRWWVGQIAPAPKGSEHEKQLNGEGWGSRYKVRILGYHPPNETDLPNDDLPWAGCLMPTTTGSGGACMGVNAKLVPGDVVVGFFLDGDDAQIPMIMGTFGRTGDIKPSEYKAPFQPFTGYTDNIKKPNGTLTSNESVGANANDGKSPRTVDQKTADQINAKKGPNEPREISAASSIGNKVVLADTCEDTLVKGITAEIENLLNKIQKASSVFLNIENELNKSVEVISGLANGFVGQMFNSLFTKFETLLSNGLNLLYRTTFGSILATTANPVAAHLGGVVAQKSMMQPVKLLEQAISCVAAKVVDGLKSTIKGLLKEVVSNVTNFVSCAAQQFAGAFLNKIIDDITSGLSSVIGGVSKILSPLFKIADFLRSGIDLIKSIGGLFDCNQNKKKCPEVKEIVIGKGPKKSANEKETFDKILDGMNVSKSVGNLASDFERQYGKWDIFGDGTKLSDAKPSATGGCYTGECNNSGGPKVQIFGGGGGGAAAKALMGSVIGTGVDAVGSCIGVQITNPGSGYQFPPFVELVDDCGQGYGAIARALINEKGEIASIYIVSPGENYPIDDVDPYGVTGVVISDPGGGYLPTDIAVDNFGTTYNLVVDAGRIIEAQPINSQVITNVPTITVISDTGEGALLRPVLGLFPQDPRTEVQQVIDCIT